MLQRGRAPESAEISTLYSSSWVTFCFNGAALRRARRLELAGTRSHFSHPLQRGRAPESAEITNSSAGSRPTMRLQRGRAPESAEIRKALPILISTQELQRGRAPESAEMGLEAHQPRRRHQSSFNGAARRRARRRVRSSRGATARRWDWLQRGRAPESAEIPPSFPRAVR